jgi:hypothetical protein
MNGFAASWMMDRPLPMRMLDTTKPGKESSDELGQKVRVATVKTLKPVMMVALKPARAKTR